MKKWMGIVATALVVILLVGLFVVLPAIRETREFYGLKDSILREVRGMNAEADRRLANQWLSVAKDYLDPYEQGKLDELYTQTMQDRLRYKSPYEDDGEVGVLAAEIQLRVRRAILAKMSRDGFSARPELVSVKMEQDDRVRKLYAVSDANHQLFLVGREAAEAKTTEELAKIEEDLEPKKADLISALVRVGK